MNPLPTKLTAGFWLYKFHTSETYSRLDSAKAILKHKKGVWVPWSETHMTENQTQFGFRKLIYSMGLIHSIPCSKIFTQMEQNAWYQAIFTVQRNSKGHVHKHPKSIARPIWEEISLL